MVSLYNKYRPQTFDEIIGQYGPVKVIRNSVELGKIHTAYLFQGHFGTGKTTLSRIFAKAINCTTNMLCNECVCKDSEIVEIDAASNRGIDDIQKLIKDLSFRPKKGKYRTIIVDEAHQLTTEALSALLKIVEDPPSHIVFIFCTTSDPLRGETKHADAFKTLLSRCIWLEFRKVDQETLAAYLQEIFRAEKEEELEKAVAFKLAKRSRGSVRDALNLLEAYLITYPSTEWLNPIEEEYALQLIENICDSNGENTLLILNTIWDDGLSMEGISYYAQEIIRDILLLQIGTSVHTFPDILDRMQDLTKQATPYLLQLYRQFQTDTDLILFLTNTNNIIEEDIPTVNEILEEVPPLKW